MSRVVGQAMHCNVRKRDLDRICKQIQVTEVERKFEAVIHTLSDISGGHTWPVPCEVRDVGRSTSDVPFSTRGRY